MGNKLAEFLSKLTTTSEEITDDIIMLNFTIVNAFLVGKKGAKSGEWVLVDTGLENSGDYIVKIAEERFGKDSKPGAIILTHGHFDHVGSIKKLAKLWEVPVYIHEKEIPYVTGEKNYPLGDPGVDEGMIAKMSPTFPHTSIDIKKYIKALPSDNTVPFMNEWKWIFTPGHSEGHISLFREKDRVLISADAIINVKQESLMSVLTQKEEINSPPEYLTTDFLVAKKSIEVLKDLNPNLILPSHGKSIVGKEKIEEGLNKILTHYEEVAIPKDSKFSPK